MQSGVAKNKIDAETHSLEEKIQSRSANISVIGLGYVGLPLAVALARTSFSVTGVDLKTKRVSKVNKGESYISGVNQDELSNLIKLGNLRARKGFGSLKGSNIVLICVPTPITKAKHPDLSHVINATEQVAKYIQLNQLIVLESTTYPGTTEEVVLPILESTGLKVGGDFYLAFSPERIDPGNKRFNIYNTPKVVGGVTEKCGKIAERLYSTIAGQVIRVSSPKVAETTKLFENVFRNVNIALVNELSVLCRKMGITVWEVIDAASTKPFGFMRFDPGPGVGGHCIGIDPYYLAAKAREFDFHTRFIELSGEINENMPYCVVERIGEALNQRGKAIKGSKILIIGVTYKRDIDDTRESPALKIIKTLQEKGAVVYYNDPYVLRLSSNGHSLTSVRIDKRLLNSVDCAVIVTDHSCYDYKEIVQHSKLVVDTRNTTKAVKNGRKKIQL